MDLLLENGEIKKAPSGRPIQISGLDELKQRIYIRLKAYVGSFIYDRGLGSRVSELSEVSTNAEILSVVREALPELFDAELISAELGENVFIVKFRSEYGEFMLDIPIDTKTGEEDNNV